MENLTKKAPKPTAFDPSSTELDPVSLMDCLKVGLQEHVPSAVILQVFPRASPVALVSNENKQGLASLCKI